jgi:TctA family transporter
MIDALNAAWQLLLVPSTLLYLASGVALGIVVGVLPGFGGTVGLAVLLPFVYGMEPTAGVVMLVGVMSVVATSDTFPAVLMGIPGSVSSQATVVDGFPLAKKGEASRALGAAFSASMIGGVVGALVLTFAVYLARPIVLAFGTGEMLMLIIFGLTLVATISEQSLLKGLAAAVLGLALGSIGTAPATSEYRMVFDSAYLALGLPLTVVALAMFAIPEIVDLMRRNAAVSEEGTLGAGWLDGVRETFRNWWLVLRCSGLGVLIGMLPGLGGSVVDWIAYGHASQSVRAPRDFGNGDIRGVIAPESANNAKEGGALIPALVFAIPGSGVTAIFLGGLILLGYEPGLRMAMTELDTIYLVVWALAIANIAGGLLCFGLAGPISRLTRLNFNILAPFVLVLIFFSAFQATRTLNDIVLLVVLGVLAIYMRRFGFSRPALMIGFVLAEGLERNLYQTIGFYGWDVLTRPLVLVIAALALLSAIAAMGLGRMSAKGGETSPEFHTSRVQYLLPIGLILFGAFIVAMTHSLRFQGAVFPVSTGTLLVAIGLLILLRLRLAPTGHSVVCDLEQQTQGLGRLWAQLAWPVGLLLSTAVLGLVASASVFVGMFLLVRARIGLPWSVAGSALSIAILLGLGQALSLRYPEGLIPGLF